MSLKPVNFQVVTDFENKIAEFFGAPYAVATDSCTHGIELCLRYLGYRYISTPKHTYVSVPMLAFKLNLELIWDDCNWVDYYKLNPEVIDAAVLWRKGSYISGTYMNISFQFQKHLNLGRGGMILTDNKTSAIQLKKMSYDGRLPGIPWREQNIDTVGYHYYMTPETAQLGLDKLPEAIATPPKLWSVNDWPDVSQMDVFKNMI